MSSPTRSYPRTPTLAYPLSPTLYQVNGHTSGVDAWALGILICEILSGATPFAGHGEVMKTIAGKRRFVRAEAGEAKVMFSIAETQTKGVKLPTGRYTHPPTRHPLMPYRPC